MFVNWKSQYCKNGNLKASQVAQWLKKNLPANVGDSGLIPGSGGSPGVGNESYLPTVIEHIQVISMF